jgi:hypothetical protein
MMDIAIRARREGGDGLVWLGHCDGKRAWVSVRGGDESVWSNERSGGHPARVTTPCDACCHSLE